MCTSQAELDSQSWYDYKNEQEEERNEMTIETSKQAGIKVGDHVRLPGSDEYLGKVKEIGTFYIVTQPDGSVTAAFNTGLEIAPRLTPDEAWAELPYTILAKINSYMSWGAVRLDSIHQKAIRSECYRLLGGAGIKVDENVKGRVRKAVGRLAEALGVELA